MGLPGPPAVVVVIGVLPRRRCWRDWCCWRCWWLHGLLFAPNSNVGKRWENWHCYWHCWGPALGRGCHWRWHPQSLGPQKLRCPRCQRGRRYRRPRTGLDWRPPSRRQEWWQSWWSAGITGGKAWNRWLIYDHHHWPLCCGPGRRRPPGCRRRSLGGGAVLLGLVRRPHRRPAAGAGRNAPSPWLRGS